MNFTKGRRALRLIRPTRNAIDGAGLFITIAFFISFLPAEILNAQPPTGGDMGSHFWPLLELVKQGIPNWTLRVWNPGNLGGEPLLIHYFPLPFVIMAFMSLFMPLAAAFKIGTMLPIALLPASVYVCLRGLGHRFPAPLIGAAFCLMFLYNESYSMFGGNTLSTLAGQFAHAYAIDFLLIGIGVLGWEIRTRKAPFLSGGLFAAVATSHAYVFLCLPSFLLSLILFFPFRNGRSRFWICASSMLFSVLLSFWFLVPMVDNQKWTTPYSPQWSLALTIQEGFSKIFIPAEALLALSLVVFPVLFYAFKVRIRNLLKEVGFWLIPVFSSVIFYLLAHPMGVVNSRSLPQFELTLIILSSVLFSMLLTRFGGKAIAWAAALPILLLSVFWADLHCKQFPGWALWNFTGWEPKPLYKPLRAMMDVLQGDFSMPRVAYEHNGAADQTGTVRVFEMIPFFSGRATLESVYLQSTILAPMVFYNQALISRDPSCPFWELDCPKYDLASARPKLDLLGVGDLILTTAELKKQAAQNPNGYTAGREFVPWQVFQLLRRPALVEAFSTLPFFRELDVRGWKQLFYDWFKTYTGSEPFLIANLSRQVSRNPSFWSGGKNCHPAVQVNFNELFLKTDCPGKPHFLKFAFHPSWSSDSGEELFLVSPGFLGIVPLKTETHIRFGQRTLWRLATWVSILSLLGMVGLARVLRVRYAKLR